MKNQTRTTILKISLLSLGLSTIGLLVDSDPPENLSTTLFDFTMMTIMVFLIVSGIYFGSKFTFKKVQQMFS